MTTNKHGKTRQHNAWSVCVAGVLSTLGFFPPLFYWFEFTGLCTENGMDGGEVTAWFPLGAASPEASAHSLVGLSTPAARC